jgi:hypothetical protein
MTSGQTRDLYTIVTEMNRADAMCVVGIRNDIVIFWATFKSDAN